MISEYTFLYLVKEDNKDQAIKEIKEKYNIYVLNGENYIPNSKDMYISDISDNYVRLSFYNRYSENEVKFNSKKEENKITININDDRYSYINEFIEDLLNKKLDTRDFKLSISEMKLISDDFIKKYKNSKRLVKDIK